MQQQNEQQLLLDLSYSLQIEAARLEFIRSSSGTQQVTFYGQTFYPTIVVVNILTSAAGGRDPRSPQDLEALILSQLKDTSSTLYQVATQIREIFVHEYTPPQSRGAIVNAAPVANPVVREVSVTAGARGASVVGSVPSTPAVKAPVFTIRPAKNGESEIEVDETMSGPRRFEVQLVRGRNLPKMDNFGTIDGYCDVTFNKSNIQATQVKKNTYSPDWGDSFIFEVDDVSRKPVEGLKIVLMDWDRLSKNERVGEVVVSADRIWDVLRTKTNWLEEKDRQVFENSKVVIGNNKQPTVLTIKLKCLDPTQEKEDAWKLMRLKQAESQKLAEGIKQVKLGAGVPPTPSQAVPPQAILPQSARSAKGPRILEFTVIRGLHMPKMDTFNTIDSYCEISFGSHPQQKTETKKNTYSPVWNQPFTYNIPDVSVRPAPIVVTVFDWNAVGKNDKVGKIDIPSDQVWDFLQKDFHEDEVLELPIVGDNGRPVVGNDKGIATIYFKVMLSEWRGAGVPQAAAQSGATVPGSGRPSLSRDDQASGPRRLELTLIRGQHMPKTDSLGSIDPYCEIRFGSQVFTSNHVKGSYSPVWNEPFVLNLQDVSRMPSPIQVTVFDWNRLGKNTRVGGFEISSDDVWDTSKMNIGWQTEKEWPLVTDDGENVIGNDKLVATISLKLRILDAGIDQRIEMQRTNSKLEAMQQEKQNSVKTYKLGTAAPAQAQNAVKTYKLGAAAPPQAQYEAEQRAIADARARQQWEFEQARLAANYHAQYLPPAQYYQSPLPQEYYQTASPRVDNNQAVFEHEEVFRRNHEHVAKSCHEMEDLLNSIRIVKYN